MDAKEARSLVERCIGNFPRAGLPGINASSIVDIRSTPVARLWKGMGSVHELRIRTQEGEDVVFLAKRIQLPKKCSSLGDRRKKDSYEVEATFYSKGHAEEMIQAGCPVPFPLLVDHSRGSGLTICMTKLHGLPGRLNEEQSRAALSWLARLHGTYWGPLADAAVERGLQPQGTFWYLDTRPEELANMPSRGWEGRLKLAAKALDLRLKADPMQTICHGDPKGENMLFAEKGGELEALVYDFQYLGKAPPTKDLAYLFTCASSSPELEQRLLRFYHSELSKVLEGRHVPPTFEELDASLALSFCDLARWMSGWGGWWGENIVYKTQEVLFRLDGGTKLASEEAYIDAMRREFPVD